MQKHEAREREAEGPDAGDGSCENGGVEGGGEDSYNRGVGASHRGLCPHESSETVPRWKSCDQEQESGRKNCGESECCTGYSPRAHARDCTEIRREGEQRARDRLGCAVPREKFRFTHPAGPNDARLEKRQNHVPTAENQSTRTVKSIGDRHATVVRGMSKNGKPAEKPYEDNEREHTAGAAHWKPKNARGRRSIGPAQCEPRKRATTDRDHLARCAGENESETRGDHGNRRAPGIWRERACHTENGVGNDGNRGDHEPL